MMLKGIILYLSFLQACNKPTTSFISSTAKKQRETIYFGNSTRFSPDKDTKPGMLYYLKQEKKTPNQKSQTKKESTPKQKNKKQTKKPHEVTDPPCAIIFLLRTRGSGDFIYG